MTDEERERVEKLAHALFPSSFVDDAYDDPSQRTRARTYAERALAAITADPAAYGFTRLTGDDRG